MCKIGRTSVPMNMLNLGDCTASRGVFSPAITVSVAFAKMVVTLIVGLLVGCTSKTFQLGSGTTYLVMQVCKAFRKIKSLSDKTCRDPNTEQGHRSQEPATKKRFLEPPVVLSECLSLGLGLCALSSLVPACSRLARWRPLFVPVVSFSRRPLSPTICRGRVKDVWSRYPFVICLLRHVCSPEGARYDMYLFAEAMYVAYIENDVLPKKLVFG